MNFKGSANRHTTRATPGRSWLRVGVGAASAALTVATLALAAAPAGASTAQPGPRPTATPTASPSVTPLASPSATPSALATPPTPRPLVVPLRGMPEGVVAFGRTLSHRLVVRALMYGLTPGSSHAVDLQLPGRPGLLVHFTPITANGLGQAAGILSSSYRGRWVPGSQLIVRMGVGPSRLAQQPIAVTGRLFYPGSRPQRLTAVEASFRGLSTPRGVATIAYDSRRHALIVTVTATGVSPGLHAVAIYTGGCVAQGRVRYRMFDLFANGRGVIWHQVRVISRVFTPVPSRGWYLTIHQGSSRDIFFRGRPTILYRPLLCGDVSGGAVRSN
jgi:hypothetical protein